MAVSMKRAKFWLALTIVIFMIVSLFGSGWWSAKKPAPPRPAGGPPTLTPEAGGMKIILDFGNGAASQTYTLQEPGATTALGALRQLASENNFPVQVKESDFGVLVEAIAGVENSQEQFWMYYVNGQLAQTAADQYQLKAGDLVEWKYEKFE